MAPVSRNQESLNAEEGEATIACILLVLTGTFDEALVGFIGKMSGPWKLMSNL